MPCAPIHDLAQVSAQPQTEAIGMLQDVPDGNLRVVGLPLSFDGVRPPVLRRAPRIGEDNERFGLPAVGARGKEGTT